MVGDVTTAAADEHVRSGAHGAVRRAAQLIGTRAAAHLDRAYFALFRISGEACPATVPATPSLRWYRLLDQLAERGDHGDGPVAIAAFVHAETSELEATADNLLRGTQCSEQRKRIATELQVASQAVSELLDLIELCAVGGQRSRNFLATPWAHAVEAQLDPERTVPAAPEASTTQTEAEGVTSCTAGDVAYMTDTSGSSGSPTGVVVHSNKPANPGAPDAGVWTRGERLPGTAITADNSTDDLLPPGLVQAAVAGDAQATAALLSRIRPQVQRFCRARLGRRETTMGSADDVAQDVCMAVLTVLPDYRFAGVSFRAFVFGIARHKIAEVFRAMARNRCDAVEELPERISSEQGPEQLVLEAERNDRLGDLLSVLGDRQIEILTLRIAVGLTAEETAEALKTTPGAVRVAQHRALQRLRRELEERAVRGGGSCASPSPPEMGSAAASVRRSARSRPARLPAKAPAPVPFPEPRRLQAVAPAHVDEAVMDAADRGKSWNPGYLCSVPPLYGNPTVAADWITEVLGIREARPHVDPDATIDDLELERDGAILVLGRSSERWRVNGNSQTRVYVDDVDDACLRVLVAGGAVDQEPIEQPAGVRQAVVTDPEGNRWQLARHVRDAPIHDHSRHLTGSGPEVQHESVEPVGAGSALPDC